VKVGDLVRVPNTCDVTARTNNGALVDHTLHIKCSCFFCKSGSNRIGIISAPAELNMWCVMFDAGQWKLFEKEMELIND